MQNARCSPVQSVAVGLQQGADMSILHRSRDIRSARTLAPGWRWRCCVGMQP